MGRTDLWYQMKRNARREVEKKLEDVGFELTGEVNAVFAIFGWLDSDLFDEVKSWDEIVNLEDRYPYLIQQEEVERYPQLRTPHPYDLESYLEGNGYYTRMARDRYEKNTPKH